MGFPCRRCRSEEGAFLIVWALLLVALFTMVAIVIDLGALRADRRKERAVADAAAAAGASELKNGSSLACTTALKYAVRNLGIDDSTYSCGTIAACDPTAPSETEFPASAGGYSIRITHGVMNTNPLMNAEAVGGDITQLANETADGKECDRIGVEISYTRESTFGKVVGIDQNTTKAHSVATFRSITGDIPNSLALLHPTDCNSLETGGSGGVSVVIPAGKVGSIATDSTGSNCTSGGSTVLSDGNAGIIVCNELGTTGSCAATAVAIPSGIYVNALNNPACTGSCPYGGADPISPVPVRSPKMVTRSPVDYRYNCKANYTNSGTAPNYENTLIATGDPLPRCLDAPVDSSRELDFINELVRRSLPPFVTFPLNGALNPPAPVFSVTNCAAEVWTVSRSRSVDCDPPDGTTVSGPAVFLKNVTNTLTVDGNAVFRADADKKDLTVNGNAVFMNAYNSSANLTIRGNAFFNGNFSSKGLVSIGALSGTYPSSCDATYAAFITNADTCLRSFGATANLMVVRGDIEQQTGGSDWSLNRTFAYSTGRFKQQGSAALRWTAPTTGPFAHLAYWSESTAQSELGGGGTIVVSGTFFAPRGRFVLQGGPAMSPQGAQFIALGLTTGGSAVFKLQPDTALVSLPFSILSTLIR